MISTISDNGGSLGCVLTEYQNQPHFSTAWWTGVFLAS